MTIKNILIGFCSVTFMMIGADKFISFLEPPCSLMGSVHPTVWKSLGLLQVASSILIWLPRFKKYVIGFFAVFMLVFTSVHLLQNTYDIGGSTLMGCILALLAWDPAFLSGKKP